MSLSTQKTPEEDIYVCYNHAFGQWLQKAKDRRVWPDKATGSKVEATSVPLENLIGSC